MTLTLSTQWQYNSYPSAMESNLRINRALSFQQESRYRGMVQEGLYKHPIQSLAKANTPNTYQAAIWRLCEAQDPPQESPEDFGWYKDEISGLMLPKFHDTSLVLAPEELLKLIRCQCKAIEGRCALYQVLRMFF